MPAITLKTFLRFMLKALHMRDQSPCDLPGRRRARRLHTGWRRIILHRGTCLRAYVWDQGAGVANGTEVQVVEELKHEPRFLLPRSQAFSLNREPAAAEFCSRRGSLLADHRRPIHTLLCQIILCALPMFYCFGGFRLGLGLLHRPIRVVRR